MKIKAKTNKIIFKAKIKTDDGILGIKYLGISLSEIKEITENGDIADYYNLMQKQKDIIKERILELKKLEESLDNSGQVINRIMNFKNQYDFSRFT